MVKINVMWYKPTFVFDKVKRFMFNYGVIGYGG